MADNTSASFLRVSVCVNVCMFVRIGLQYRTLFHYVSARRVHSYRHSVQSLATSAFVAVVMPLRPRLLGIAYRFKSGNVFITMYSTKEMDDIKEINVDLSLNIL